MKTIKIRAAKAVALTAARDAYAPARAAAAERARIESQEEQS